MESKMFHLLKEAAKSWAWIFVPHRENGDVMPRPYKSVRTIYRMYVAKLDDPCTFLLNQTESETARIGIAKF